MILKVRRQEKNRHINKEEIASHDNKYLYERSIKEANREKKKELETIIHQLKSTDAKAAKSDTSTVEDPESKRFPWRKNMSKNPQNIE